MNDEPNRDSRLLRDYAAAGSEPAFRALVAQYLPLVNATALRLVNGDAHLAQDVSQLVFSDLARKAGSLSSGVVLGGWLYRHTCFTASKVVRAERARRARDHAAFEMNSLHPDPGPDQSWSHIAPVLDDALGRLPAADRDALVLRFFEQRDLRSIGQALGTGEDAAQKRVARALEKLRAAFLRRGLPLSSALLAAALDVHAVTPVSAALTASVSTSALASSAVPAGFTLTSLKTMLTSKLALTSVAAVVTVSAAAFVAFTPAHPAPAPTLPAPAQHAATPAPKAIPPVPAPSPVFIPAPLPTQPSSSSTFVADDDSATDPVHATTSVSGAGLVKTGSGTLTLSSSPYSGATVVTETLGSWDASVNAGVLTIDASAATPADGTVILYNLDSSAPAQVIVGEGTVQTIQISQP